VRFRRFYLASLLSHLPLAFVARAAGARLDVEVPAWAAIGIAVLLFLPLRGRIRLAFRDRPIGALRRWLIEEPYHVHLGAVLLALPAFGVLGAAALVAGEWSRLDDAYVASWLVGLVLSAFGVLVQPRLLRVRRVEVPIAGLDAALDGFRIAQLSDVHLGSLCPRGRVERWVRRVNALDVDLVALTGDYVSSGVSFHAEIAETLGALRGREGVLAVMGNHDYYGNGEPLLGLLAARGVRVLRNEHLTLSRGDARLCVAGVDDLYTRRGDVHRAVAGRDPDVPLVALAHDPRRFPELARAGAALTLSGHTHWGQLALPFFAERLNMARLLGPQTAGLHALGDARLWVSPGLGATGSPLRIGAAPEVTVLELRACEPPAAGR
jgi:predicted MPP superfamily phosphohydrolase